MLALLGGCNALRLGYGQGPNLAYWWLDGYIDFDDAQAPRARAAIADWFQWHRSTQLPGYAVLLARAQAELVDPVTPAQVCRWVDVLHTRLDTSVEHALPLLAGFVRAMTPRQFEQLESKYAKNLEKHRHDFLQRDPGERSRAQLKRVTKHAEMLYGRLNDAQRARIEQLDAESPFDPQGWLVERERRQQDALRALRRLSATHAGNDEARAVLQRLYHEMFSSPRAPYRAYQQRLQQFNCGLAAEVHRLATPAQRAHAAERLAGWEEDVRTLAGQAP